MYNIGLDIGSTTIKCVVRDQSGNVVYKTYKRHLSRARQEAEKLLELSEREIVRGAPVKLAVTGSSGLGICQNFGLPFVQEVYAAQLAVKKFYPGTDVVIELGGEDAKILFLSGVPEVRMNGSCAGGTGSFIDQMATLLGVDLAEFDRISLTYKKIYTIASRCGVFAKSDIQPLVNQGAQKNDLAASIFGAVVNQTIGGLAQGRDIKGNVLFLGGPLSFFKGLQRQFTGILGLREEQAIFPEDAQYFVALGAAEYANGQEDTDSVYLKEILERLNKSDTSEYTGTIAPLFSSAQEYEEFNSRHSSVTVKYENIDLYSGDAFLGIDAGSTTTKLVLITPGGDILYQKYISNMGNAIPIVRDALLEIYDKSGDRIKIRGSAATGYGEELIKNAFGLNSGVVETVAHYTAAKRFRPDVDFIIDIGGQDIKCFKLKNGAVDSIMLNEACSSGCGSFIQTFAVSLGYSVEDFAKQGLFAKRPVDLGSRCTVFMNSSVKQAQKEGAGIDDISAGLSISVVKNAVYKVIRAISPSDLGKNVVVQGGTFLNDAVLRAFERELDSDVTRAPISGLMGAYGCALYAIDLSLKHKMQTDSAVISRTELENFTHSVSNAVCNRCENHCRLTVNKFTVNKFAVNKFTVNKFTTNKTKTNKATANETTEGKETANEATADKEMANKFTDKNSYISGNICSRYSQDGQADEKFNAYKYKYDMLSSLHGGNNIRGKIGIPLALNNYENLPFWYAFFTTLGFEIVLNPRSSRELYLKGQHTIPSDTVCYPAKLVHGQIEALAESGVDAIFYPCLPYNFDEKLGDNHYNCPVVAYYPEVIEANVSIVDKPNLKNPDFVYIYDYFGLHRPRDFTKKIHEVLKKRFSEKCFSEKGNFPQITFKETVIASKAAYTAYEKFRHDIAAYTLQAIEYARENSKPIIVLAGRPYHIDPEINHGIDRLFSGYGAVVVTEDGIVLLAKKTRVDVLNQWTYHSRLYAAAEYVCDHNDMNLVQLVSFGCGVDAVTADEVRRILEDRNKLYTQIKIDEIANLGAARIRIRSLFAAINEKS
ncbi:MAG: acyl-CoA dehydratase activase-related protein [Oscillospiraceae bacterium]|nr:acyl-CoA dehydratase activase-related protein [Oscillospiraceae bacterium]